MHRLRGLRDKLQEGIFERLDEVYLNGHPTERLPGNLNLSFAYVEGESLMMGMKDMAVSSGSACTSATLEPSYVIRALGTDEELAHSSIRFGLGRFNTEEEVDFVTRRVTEEVKRLRDMSPLYEMAKEGIDLKSVQWKTRVAPEARKIEGEELWLIQKRYSTITTTRATSAASPRGAERRHRRGRRARMRRRDEAAAQDQSRERGDRGRAVQDLRLRQRDRQFQLRDRTGQGQAYRRGDGDQEQRDRRGAESAAGQDPLLGAGRGRDQGGDHRLEGKHESDAAAADESEERAGG